MYYQDKEKLTTTDFINKLKSNNQTLYDEFVQRGYKFWESPSYHLSDGLAQKCIRNTTGDKLFFIDCYCYIYDKERFPAYPDDQEKVKYSCEAWFYLENDEDKYCTVQLNVKDLDYVEKFFLDFFEQHKCQSYEKAN